MKGTDKTGARVQIKPGDRVSFKHPEDGREIEGTVKGRTRSGGIKVVQVTGFKREGATPPSAPGNPPGRAYSVEETIWTVPKMVEVKILISHLSPVAKKKV